MTCKIEGCSTTQKLVRGLCNKHYLRWLKYGDAEHPLKKPAFKHGGVGTPEYGVYSRVKSRCFRPTDKSYPDYGGRGITMCPEWISDFAAFARDMGPRPSPQHSIERIDNDGPYSPANCRWATKAEQNANTRATRRVLLDGELIHLSEAARRMGHDLGYVVRRLAADGVTVVRKPPMRRSRLTKGVGLAYFEEPQP